MIVVIGTGLAGYSLVREFRKVDRVTPVLMLSADDGASYSKPMLSTAFAKSKSATDLAVAGAGAMAEQLEVEIRIHTRVTGLLPETREILIGNERLSYERLVLALGAEPRSVPLAGDGAAEVLAVNDLGDYRRLRERLRPGTRVAILGAGLIGCEFAEDFVAGGMQVRVIAPSATALPLLVPSAVGDALVAGLAARGVDFHLGRVAQRIERRAERLVLWLDDGASLDADVVVSAIGLRPRVELARAGGLDVGQGVRVDALCRSSDPHIFALGDCAEVDGRNLLYVQPLMECARALARTLSGTETAVRYPPMPVIVKTPACPVVALTPEGEGSWCCEELGEQGVRALFRGVDGRLDGFALAGRCVEQKQTLTAEVKAARTELG